LSLALAVLLVFAGCSGGCATLQPGANALVVRVEQTQVIAKSTFDLVLNVDNSNRPFWTTNLPAFHGFCEYLRAPVPIDASNSLPRGAAWLWSLDQTKLSYKSSLSSSNALVSALAVVETGLSQAQLYLAQTQPAIPATTTSTPK
jgi:hypothetical protein